MRYLQLGPVNQLLPPIRSMKRPLIMRFRCIHHLRTSPLILGFFISEKFNKEASTFLYGLWIGLIWLLQHFRHFIYNHYSTFLFQCSRKWDMTYRYVANWWSHHELEWLFRVDSFSERSHWPFHFDVDSWPIACFASLSEGSCCHRFWQFSPSRTIANNLN